MKIKMLHMLYITTNVIWIGLVVWDTKHILEIIVYLMVKIIIFILFYNELEFKIYINVINS